LEGSALNFLEGTTTIIVAYSFVLPVGLASTTIMLIVEKASLPTDLLSVKATQHGFQ